MTSHDVVLAHVPLNFEGFLWASFMKEVEKRGLQVAVAGIPKTIDNDLAVSFYLPQF